MMLLFIQSIIVYGLIIWVMTYFGNIAYRKQYPQGFGGIDMFQNRKIPFITLFTKNYLVIPILVFCFFAAVRYRVGVDCESYKSIFYQIIQFGNADREEAVEIGFLSLVKLTKLFTNSHYLLFFILAFLQIGLLYYAQRKSTYSLKFFGVSLFLSITYFSLMNGIRQNIAACAFVALLPLIREKKWIWYILGVYVATFIHKSAYLLLPLGIVAFFLKSKIPNKYVQLGLVAICFIFMDEIKIDGIMNSFSTFAAEIGYDESQIEVYTSWEDMNKRFGLRSLLLLASYIITICYSEKMKTLFNSKIFNMQYNLFFIGICLSLLFNNNFVIGRILYYLKIFIPIILSSCLFYLWNSKRKNDKLFFSLLIFVLAIVFLYQLYASSQEFPNEFSLYKFDLFRT